MSGRWRLESALLVLCLLAAYGVSSSPHPVVLSACQAELTSGKPSMPSSTRLVTIRVYNFNGIRLSSPPRSARPTVSATRVWKAASGMKVGVTYRLVLAEWYSGVSLDGGTVPTFHLLVWVVFGRHVALLGTRGPCRFVSAMWPVNATTGVAYGEMSF